jgi:hypothetical protein
VQNIMKFTAMMDIIRKSGDEIKTGGGERS